MSLNAMEPSAGAPRREALWVPFARELTGAIVRGDYPPESHIPTETELSEQFGVSRTVVREGMRVLADKGLVRIERGRGTIVEPQSAWRVFDADVLSARLMHGDTDRVLRDVLLVRKAVEPELAATAARHADDAAMARIEAAVEAFRRDRSNELRYLADDEEFHDAIADASGVALARDLFRALAAPLRIQRRLTGTIPRGFDVAHRHHLRIWDAIGKRDPDAARDAMRAHLEWAETRLGDVL
jgi:GntR family galactonate operon transcriptional repressor